jgi:membrane-associated phospholipid phosphatase
VVEVLVALVLPAALLGVVVGLAANRWPRPVEAPAVQAPDLVEAEARAGAWLGRLQRRLDPSRLTGLALTVALAILGLGTLGVGLLLRMVDTDTGFARYDLTFTRFGADHSADWTTELMRLMSQLGGYKGVILIGLLVAAYEVHRTRRVAVVAFLVVVIGGQYAVAETIKHVVDRTRPDLLNLTGFSGSSFPSGHATAAAATFMAVALLLSRGRRPTTRAVLTGVAAGVAGLVAATRVLLGVHWFTDVLAGMLVGWAWFALCSIAFGGRLLRFGAPAEEAEEAAEVAVEVRELAP